MYDRALFVIGCTFTLFMLIKIIMMFVGSDGEVDSDGVSAYSGANLFGLNILTFRAVSAFLSIGSWTILALNMMEVDVLYSTLVGIGAGCLAAFSVAWIMYKITALQTTGNLEIKYVLGKSGEVYLTIPKAKSGSGKVSVYLEDRYVEFEAVTEGDVPLPTGTSIKVTGMIGENMLIVDRLVG
jgi:hypothetical protein